LSEPGFELIHSPKSKKNDVAPNLYEFVINSPINYLDPHGLDPCLDAAMDAFKGCMCLVNQQTGDAYELLHQALQSIDIGCLLNTKYGLGTKVFCYAAQMEVRMSMILLGALYGGGAAGCGANALAAYASCENLKSIESGGPGYDPFHGP
jgi:hypothetical protein